LSDAELLTGTTPLDKERLRQAALLEALRLIREEEPPRPSMRQSESRRALVAAAVQGQTDVARLPGLPYWPRRRIRRLAWIPTLVY
jgi:eukaryotic-like serine/threonine-protein kinase